MKLPIRNVHRTVGAMLSGEIARLKGSAGLPEDTALILNLIQRHQALTGSSRAQRLLENWDVVLTQFVKVFPREYKQALSKFGDASGKARQSVHG
jgi:glutamate synthase domain-containing protein 3